VAGPTLGNILALDILQSLFGLSCTIKNISPECHNIIKMDRLDWFKIIAAYEIIGGIIGIVIASYIVASMHTVPAVIVIVVFFVLLFLLSTYAGTLLWKKDIRGIDLSIIAQIPQIFQITIPGILTYRFISGLSFPLIFEFDQARGSSSFDFSLGLLSSFNFQLGPEKDVSLLGINLVAIAAIIYLIGLRKSGFPASPTNADRNDVINGGDISREDEDGEGKDGDRMDDLQV